MADPTPRRNLERKTRCADLTAVARLLERLDTRLEGVQLQTDTYFHVRFGRLKLRVINGSDAVLIWYERPNEPATRLSRYHLASVGDPEALRVALTAGLGVRGEVRKQRTICHFHNVRIHLDDVDGLGKFVEFEAVLSATDGEEISHQRLAELGSALGLDAAQDQAGSYADLLGV
jgi:predicted adenylyl cyclase CyaB